MNTPNSSIESAVRALTQAIEDQAMSEELNAAYQYIDELEDLIRKRVDLWESEDDPIMDYIHGNDKRVVRS